MKIVIVIWKDRHSDTTVHPFYDPDVAIAWARQQATDYARHGDFKEIAITPSMKAAGWLYAVDYSCEGDGLRVVEAEIK